MKLRLFALGLVAALAAGSVVPMAASDKETRQMMADIRMLQEQQQQIQSALSALAEQLKAMDKSFNARIDDQSEAMRKGLADEKTVTTSIANDARALREKVDDNTTRVGSLAVEIQALRQLIASARASFGSSDAPSLSGNAPDSQTAAPSSAVAGISPSQMFESAFGDYTSGQFDLATDGFKAFINSYPAAPQAEEAQVYICSSYYSEGKFKEAVDSCDTAIRNYPKGGHIPTAYYRKGQSLLSLNQTEAGNAAFDFVIKTWPDSPEATLAAQKRVAPKKP